MPTYDYRCERTGEMFEFWQSFSDDALTECPQTHEGKKKVCGAPVKKVFSKVGISFKGDGFYKTDHGGSSAPATDDSSGESSSSSSSTSGSSSPSSDSATSSETAPSTDTPKSSTTD